MHREIDAVRTTRSVAVLERRLPAVRSELDEQRRFRIEQLDELRVDAAEAAATADEPLSEIDAALQRAGGWLVRHMRALRGADPMGAVGRAAGDQSLHPPASTSPNPPDSAGPSVAGSSPVTESGERRP